MTQKPVSAFSQRILDALPADGSPMDQRDIFTALGVAQNVGMALHRLQARGLVEAVDGGWRWRKVVAPC
jgi:hypothetical protein